MSKNKYSDLKNPRLTFGCLLGDVDEEYQKKICSGISNFCKINDINLIYYAGRPLEIPNKFEAQCNVIFDLISPDIIDGLIILTGTIGNYIGHKRFLKFLQKYRDLPCVSVSMKIKNMPSIIVDNKKGMYDTLVHIIEKHYIKHIAFIKGPENNYEAKERFIAYKEALKDNNIPFNSNLVVKGYFLENDGIEAINELIDERKVKFQAIVASNDEMALGALIELKNRGFNIPEDYIVIGFDNSPKINISNPPLTTVHQPLFQLGKKASEILYKLIKGEQVPEEIILPTKMVVRRSCGCFHKAIRKISLDKSISLKFPVTDIIKSKKEILKKLTDSINLLNLTTDFEHVNALNETFLKEICDKETDSFILQLDKILTKYALNESDLNKWNDIISEFRLIYLPYIIKNKNLLISSENVWHNSRILIGEAGKRILAFKNYMDGKRTVFFLNAIESFILAHEISNLMKTIIQEMPLLGIKSSYLSLYEKDNKSPSEWSRMILFFYDDKVCEVNTESQKHRFISKNLIPSDLILKNRRFEWVVEALRSKDEKQYGFIILEPKENAVVDYSNISFHISFALEEAFHFEEQKNLIRKLALSNEELEEFAYIVSHDLKNPLHTISGFLELLRQKYKSSLDEEALEIIDLCLKSGEKMKKLIVNLLDYSRLSTKMESLEEIDCNRIMKDVLFNLKSTIEKTKAIVTYDYLPTVIGDESQLTQLFQNLIDNAIKFHGIESPKVHVSIKQDSKKWIFSISDNGIGINPQNYELIFKIFKRLHTQEEYPGSGIGLAFCKKIVKRHRGKIWIKSKINEGSTFYFTIPKSVIG